MVPVLGYWSIRGLAEPLRNMLAYTGTAYEEENYHMGPGPEYAREGWQTAKKTIDLDIPNLPYWKDGNLKISESGAIFRHLARKHGLDGSTEDEKLRIDVAQGVLTDLLSRSIIPLVFGPDYLNKKPPFDASMDEFLTKCDKLLKGPYIAGERISFVDFMLLEQLERYDLLVPGAVDKYPTLVAFKQRMLSLPAIVAYRKTDKFQKFKTRFFARMCNIGHGEESY